MLQDEAMKLFAFCLRSTFIFFIDLLHGIASCATPGGTTSLAAGEPTASAACTDPLVWLIANRVDASKNPWIFDRHLCPGPQLARAFIQVLRSEPCHRFADVVPRLTPFSPFNLTYLEYLVRLGLHSAVFRQTQRQWWHSTIPSLAVSQADHMQETPGRVAAWQLKSAAMTPSGKKISRKTDCNCSNNIQMFLLFPHPWIFFTWCIYRDILIMAFTLRW